MSIYRCLSINVAIPHDLFDEISIRPIGLLFGTNTSTLLDQMAIKQSLLTVRQEAVIGDITPAQLLRDDSVDVNSFWDKPEKRQPSRKEKQLEREQNKERKKAVATGSLLGTNFFDDPTGLQLDLPG